MKLLSTSIIILTLMVNIAFASENDFIQRQTFICKDYISQSMKKEFPVNGLSAEQLMITACTKKEITENLSEQEKNHLKDLTTKLNEAKKKLSQKELDNLKQQEKLVNDNWEWLKKSIEPKNLSQLTEQEIKTLDSELRLIFKKMREALKNGDIETALTYFHHWSKERHRKMFSALPLDKLKEVASQNQELHLLPFREQWLRDRVRYEIFTIQNGQEFAFPLTFSQDQGEWKIYDY
ncbi:MAG: hypothetical protein ABSF79_03590 [Smithellaceae bacterium]